MEHFNQQLLANNERLLALWNEARHGNEEAFSRLAQGQYKSLYVYGCNLTANPDLVKDAIQEVFVRLWERRSALTIEVMGIYLFRSLRNELMGEFRRPAFRRSATLDEGAEAVSEEHTVETRIEQAEAETKTQQRLQQAIQQLPKRQQEVIFLKFYEGLDNEQIADIMTMNRQSVANLVFRALQSLRGSSLLRLSAIVWSGLGAGFLRYI